MGASSSVAADKASTAIQGHLEPATPERNINIQPKPDGKMTTKLQQTTKPNTQNSKNEKQYDTSPKTSKDDKKILEGILKSNPGEADTFEHFDKTILCMKNPDTDTNVLGDMLDEMEILFFGNTGLNKLHKMYGDYIALKGFVEPAVTRYSAIMKQGNMEILKDELYNDYDTNKSDTITQYDARLLLNIRSVFWNFSDSSILCGERVAKTGYFHFLFKDLKHLEMQSVDEVKYSSMFDTGIGILHNCGKSSSVETRECYRKEDAVKNLVPFLQTKHTNIKVLVLLTLSNIINEEENNLLLADNSVFENLIQLIKLAKKSVDRRHDGFSVEELVSGLKGLAKNDQNKPILMKKGALPLLKDIIESNKDEGEVLQATEAIRVLSFAQESKNDIKNDAALKNLLLQLAKSAKKSIRKAASGILWNIKDDNEKAKVQTVAGGHVMISYQWADQKKLLQIQQSLASLGYSVWIDINDMEGSTLQAMADAVEKACVVLVCMSERYKESSNCRTEAEYAFTLKKNIIPLMLQRSYKPDGWLGMILGAKLFVDFSGKYAYDDTLNKLVKQLGDEGRLQQIISDDDLVDGPIPVIKSIPLQAAKPAASTNQWSKSDVTKWFEKMKLEKNKHLISISGEQLYFLKRLSNRAPEFFFSYIKTDLGLNQLEDMMKFSNAIDQL